MSQSLAKVLVHIVYSTKHRKRISFQDEFRRSAQGMGSHSISVTPAIDQRGPLFL